MKFLHTGDWHVGRAMRGRSRAAEHEAVLAQLARIAAEEQVDCVLVAGDVFDTKAPTPESERIVYRALLELAETGAAVVVIGGNHDNDRRLQAITPLLELGSIQTRSSFLRPEEGGVVEVFSRDASERALVACLPFLSQRWIVRATDLLARNLDDAHLQYADHYRALVGAMAVPFAGGGTVNIVLAHAMVQGAVTVGSERASDSVFEYAVQASCFPASAHYVALGHLHRAQQVPGALPIHYPGSPLALDFGERNDEKSALLVEATATTRAKVTPVSLSGGRRLVQLEGSLAEIEALAAELTGEEWVKVRLREPLRTGLADDVRALVADAVAVEMVRDDDTSSDRERPETRAGKSPVELFGLYLSDQQVDDPALVRLFAEIYEEVEAHT